MSRALVWLSAWWWALGFNARRNVRLIRRYGLVRWWSGGPWPRHAAPGRARRRRGRSLPAHRDGWLLSAADLVGAVA